jgi:hypothetical protein
MRVLFFVFCCILKFKAIASTPKQKNSTLLRPVYFQYNSKDDVAVHALMYLVPDQESSPSRLCRDAPLLIIVVRFQTLQIIPNSFLLSLYKDTAKTIQLLLFLMVMMLLLFSIQVRLEWRRMGLVSMQLILLLVDGLVTLQHKISLCSFSFAC